VAAVAAAGIKFLSRQRYSNAVAVVPELGGGRKLRFAPKGRGKSGAFRAIYYVPSDAEPILALLIYGKNEQVNPTPEQTRAIVAVVREFKAGRRTAAAKRKRDDES
jgi:mRNA-degrading endonuclease RelE of RelBE toxin-antitoxin system